MKTTTRFQEDVKATGDLKKIKIYDGEDDFNHYQVWIKTLKEPLQVLKEHFNSNFDELLCDPAPFNKEVLKGLLFGNYYDHLYKVVEQFISGKDRAMKSYYTQYYNDKIEMLAAYSERFKAKLNDTSYRTELYGVRKLPAHLTTIDILEILDGDLVIDQSKIEAMRESFDIYTSEPDHLEYALLCNQLADIYNKLQANIKRKNGPLSQQYQLNGFLPAHYFISLQDNVIVPNYKYIQS